MKIRIVGFQKTIGMPNFSNDKPIVVEADLEEGDSLQEAWSKMNKEAIEWHRKEYPHLYQDDNQLLKEIKQEDPTVQQIENREKAKEEIEEAIRDAPTIDKLKEFKLLAAIDKKLTASYMKRLKELSK